MCETTQPTPSSYTAPEVLTELTALSRLDPLLMIVMDQHFPKASRQTKPACPLPLTWNFSINIPP